MSSQPPGEREVSVLIVDDEQSIRTTLSAILQSAGYEVETAEDVPQAEARLAARPFDLVPTDIVMPRVSGVELLHRVSELAPHALVLMMTGEPTVTTAVEAVRAGAFDYLTKPVPKQEILRVVARAAQVSALMAETRRLEAANRDYQDNLEHRVAERTQALRERDEQLSLTLHSARAVAWDVDLQTGVLTEVGPVAEVFGLPPGTCHASQAEFLERVHPEDVLMVRERIQAAVAAGGAYDAVFRVVTPDGSLRWIDAQGRVTIDDAGRPLHIRGIGRDVTEQHLMQASLAQSDRLASMGMLAAGVAHEINNPLSYLLYHLETLVEDLPELVSGVAARRPAPAEEGANGRGPSDLVRRAEEALQGAARIRDISRALGAFSRVEETIPEPVEPQVAIEHACRMAQNEVKYRARLETEFAPRLPQVLATEGKLAQVFLNLLVNAAHAMDEDRAATNTIVVRTWQDGDRVCAQVCDTGKGIAPEHVGRIFEPFFTTKPAGIGSGLGLAICRDILTGFGGGITVTSEVGVGTVFDLWLPVLPAEWAAAEGGEPVEEPSEAAVRGRVLVVDDDDAVRRMVSRILRVEHEVEEVASASEAQQRLAEGAEFDAVLCDVMMPQMSGIELHRWLREHHPGLAPRVVFVTGGAFTPGAREYLDGVTNPCLEKPFRPSTAKETVSQVVRAARRACGEH
ncbi:MAG: response regulator [Armatimonadetes bacterium]|nr:response regulator [Armatimonadota bacterium]